MPPYKVTLQAHKTVCAGTSAFYFAKPEGFEFEAGQFVNFTLLGPGDTDLEGNTRALSIASAPHERNLMVAMRLRTTAFKRTLNSLPLNTELLLQGPYGSLTLSRNGTRPAVFLAGGIGITPFRSLIWNATESLSLRRIFLFYSVRVPEEAAFLEELREMEQYNTPLQIHMHGHTTSESGNALAGRDGPNFDRNAIQVDSGSECSDLLRCWPFCHGYRRAPDAHQLRNL